MVPIRVYLSGHVMQLGMRALETAINPFVKDCMRAAFPDDPADPVMVAYEQTKAANADRLREIDEAYAVALQQVHDAKGKDEKKAAKAALKVSVL